MGILFYAQACIRKPAADAILGRAASRGKIAPARLVKRADMAEGMREYGKDSGDRKTGF